MTNTTNKKGIPNLRKDVVSQRMLPKTQLIRIVKTKNNDIMVDLTQKAPGRGVYIDRNVTNVNQGKVLSALSRGLKCKVPDHIWQELEKVINL